MIEEKIEMIKNGERQRESLLGTYQTIEVDVLYRARVAADVKKIVKIVSGGG